MGNIITQNIIYKAPESKPQTYKDVEPGVCYITHEWGSYWRVESDSNFGVFCKFIESMKSSTLISDMHTGELFETHTIYSGPNPLGEDEELKSDDPYEGTHWYADDDDDEDDEDEINEKKDLETGIELNSGNTSYRSNSNLNLRNRKHNPVSSIDTLKVYYIVKDWKLWSYYQLKCITPELSKDVISIINGMKSELKEPKPLFDHEDEDCDQKEVTEYLIQKEIFEKKLISSDKLIESISNILPKVVEKRGEKETLNNLVSELIEKVKLKSSFSSQTDSDIKAIVNKLEDMMLKKSLD